MKTLLRRFRRSLAAPVTITLYSRVDCHLCDLAKKPVARLSASYPGVTARTVDVDMDAVLRDRYGLRVPVVTATVDGIETVLAEGKISELWLRRAFADLGRGAHNAAE